MTAKKNTGRNPEELRRRAEEIDRERIRQTPEIMESLSPEAAWQLIRELRVNQIAMELQNEELRRLQLEREQVEDALRESELKYRTLVEHTSEVIFCVNKDGYYTFVNNALASALGKTPEDFIGKSFWDIYSKEQADFRHEATSKVFQTREKVQKEITVPLPDRTLFYYATINPIMDSQGNVILALVHSIDITDRKRTAEALASSEAQLRTLVETIPDLIWLKNADGVYFVV